MKSSSYRVVTLFSIVLLCLAFVMATVTDKMTPPELYITPIQFNETDIEYLMSAVLYNPHGLQFYDSDKFTIIFGQPFKDKVDIKIHLLDITDGDRVINTTQFKLEPGETTQTLLINSGNEYHGSGNGKSIGNLIQYYFISITFPDGKYKPSPDTNHIINTFTLQYTGISFKDYTLSHTVTMTSYPKQVKSLVIKSQCDTYYIDKCDKSSYSFTLNDIQQDYDSIQYRFVGSSPLEYSSKNQIECKLNKDTITITDIYNPLHRSMDLLINYPFKKGQTYTINCHDNNNMKLVNSLSSLDSRVLEVYGVIKPNTTNEDHIFMACSTFTHERSMKGIWIAVCIIIAIVSIGIIAAIGFFIYRHRKNKTNNRKSPHTFNNRPVDPFESSGQSYDVLYN